MKFTKVFPFQTAMMASFFFTLAAGWFFIRCGLWVFFFAQASLESPYIRFQVAGPVIASERAVTWNFPRLKQTIEETHIHNERSLKTETDFSDNQINLITDGLNQAEAFRQSLFEPYPSSKTKMEVIAQALIEFQKLATPQLTGRPNLDDFYLDQQELLDKMSGKAGRIYDDIAFELFNGKWYGNWDQNQVDHRWDAAYVFDPSLNIKTENLMCVRALQYAWIGDGFGWNAVTAPKCQNTGDVILGTVYHVRNQDPDDIYVHRPHVGIALDEGQLIWLTKSDIFLEQAFTHENEPEKDYYVITGCWYEIKDGTWQNVDRGFQAVYTRDPNNRPEWYRFPLELSIDL